MTKAISFFILLIVCGVLIFFAMQHKTNITQPSKTVAVLPTQIPRPTNVVEKTTSPLAIAVMKKKTYPGSDFVIEQTLSAKPTYSRYVVSYQSDGLKQYGLLTVPRGQKPAGGWPVILFNHGYIPPASYSTATSYQSYIEPFATKGFIVFKPDYRGNGTSEGTPTQIYVSPDYVTDSMNALASVKKYKDADPNNIGIFGHSMGGSITLHELVLRTDIKAAVIASGVVGNYSDVLTWWNKREATGVLTTQNDLQTLQQVKDFVKTNGTPQTNAAFWKAIDPTQYIQDVKAPVQILVGTADEDVPPAFSSSLRDTLQKAKKTVDYHAYQGADHNLIPDTTTALNQAVSFFTTNMQ